MLPALPDPQASTVAAMHDGCRNVEAWMADTDDVVALAGVDAWLDAVETFLESKNAQGPAQTTHRLLDARIGHLMGPGPGRGHPEKEEYARVFPRPGDRRERRLMAENKDVWLDKLPLPRKRVLRLIRDDLADLRPIPEHPADVDPMAMTDAHRDKFPELATAELSAELARGINKVGKTKALDPKDWGARVNTLSRGDIELLRSHLAHVRSWVEEWEDLLDRPRLQSIGDRT